jgi:MFS transporter, CP family, cyanate transporter
MSSFGRCRCYWFASMKASSLIPASSRRSTLFFSLCIVLIAANLRAPITSLGPVLGQVQSALGLNDSAGGFLSALPLIVFAMLSLVAPAFGRAVGVERGLGAALLAILVGTVLRSTPVAFAIWVGTVVISAGIAIGNVLLPGLVKRRVPEHAAAVIGVYAAAMATFAGLGAGLAVPISQLPSSSWRMSLGVWAVLAAVALAVWMPQTRCAEHPASGGRLNATRHASPWTQTIGWHVSAFFACQSFVFYSIVSWYTVIVSSRGASAAAAGVALLLYQLVAIATNLGAAPIIKRARDQRGIGTLCGALLLVGTVGLASGAPAPTAWLLIAGLGAGLSMTTCLSLFGLRSSSHEQAAELSAMAQFVGYAGAAVGPVIFGALHQATSSWTLPLATLVGISILVVIFAYLAGRNKTMA